MEIPTKQIVPWYNREEFETIYKRLFYSDRITCKEALARIEIWKGRMGDSLPTAIECTLLLFNAKVMDTCTSRTIATSSNAMALIRFVNLLVEKYQKEYHTPVTVLSEEIGIPYWMVELRNKCSHTSLPDLCELQTATKFALKWLKTNYWLAALKNWYEPGVSQDSTTDSEGDLSATSGVHGCPLTYTKKAVSRYKEIGYILNSSKINKTLKTYLKSQKVELMQEMIYFLSLDHNTMAYFADHLTSVMCNCDYAIKMTSLDLKLCQLKLNTDTLNVWMPLIKQLSIKDHLQHILVSLIGKIKGSSKSCKIAACWIKYLFNCSFNCNDNLNTSQLDYNKLIELFTDESCVYSMHLIQQLNSYKLCKPHLQHLNIISILTTMELELDSGKEDIIAKASNMEKKIPIKLNNIIDKPTEKIEIDNSEVESEWKLDESTDWSKYPLGTVPYQVWSYNGLDVPDDNDEFKSHQSDDTSWNNLSEDEQDEEDVISINSSHYWAKMDVNKLIAKLEID